MKGFLPYIIILLLALGCKSKIVKSEANKYPLRNDTMGIDSVVYKAILPYKFKVDSAMNTGLGMNDVAMPAPDRKNIAKETLLGSLLADIFLNTANANYKPTDGKPIDFVLVNTGGVRTSLPQGKITVRNVFEILPFDNRLTVVTMSGDSVQSLFNYIAKKGGDPVAGLTMGIKDKKPVSPLIQGKPFDVTKTYKVLTNDFCAAGGDYMWFFTGAKGYEDLDILMRDAVIGSFKISNIDGKHITSQLDGRIYEAR